MSIEEQNQKDLKNWEGSTVTLMGDPKEKRPFFLKTVTKALVAILAFQATAALAAAVPEIGHRTPGTKRGVTYEQAYQLPGYNHSELGKIVQSMDKDGKAINQYFGNNNTVFIWANDAQLKDVLDKTNPNFIHGIKPETTLGKIKAAKQVITEDYSKHFEYSRQNAYDNIRSPAEGETIQLLDSIKDPETGERDSIYVIKSDISSQKSLEDRDHSYPRFASKEELTHQQFFVSMSRGVNRTPNYGDNPADTFSTPDVAIADLAFAMVSLKHTGNLDAWNLNLKAERMTSLDDPLHMTAEWVDQALKGITHESVKNMSDKEIMLFAKDRMTTAYRENTSQMMGRSYDRTTEIANAHILYTAKIQPSSELDKVSRYEKEFNDYHLGEKRINNADLVRNYSLKAMEASMNNMAYQGKLVTMEGEFIKSVQNHAKQFNDPDAITALNSSMKNGNLDYKQFSEKMNMKVDFESSARRDHNSEIMMRHLNEIVPVKVEKGLFSMSSLEVNSSSSAMEYFAAKTEKSNDLSTKSSPSFNV